MRLAELRPYSDLDDQTKETNVLNRLYLAFLRYDQGASMVEYALLVILIAIVALVAVQVAGNELSSTYSEIGSEVANAGP